MNRTILFLCCCIVLFALTSCTTQQGAAIGAGIGGAMLALDQMLSGGVINPEQHHALQAGFQAVQQTAQAASEIAAQAKTGGLTAEGGTGIAVGVSTLVAAGLNAYRNATRKVVLAKPAA